MTSDTGDSDVASTAAGGAEGPHVSYFIDPNRPDAEKQKIKNAAQRVADLLNEKQGLPQGFGPFVIKEHNDSSQAHSLGVWF
jgi:hypothetical protein